MNNLKNVFRIRVASTLAALGRGVCHASSKSEKIISAFSKPEKLLNTVKDIKVPPTEKWDKCCGLGGTFCVFEEEIFVKMLNDRFFKHEVIGVEYITSIDTSCLMRLEVFPGEKIARKR